MIDRYASMAHYAAHIGPVWRELDRRGLCGASWGPRGRWWAGDGTPPRPAPHSAPQPVMVASYADAERMRGRPLVYVEHGAGQSYPADRSSSRHGSYSGGDGLHDVVLFLAPNDHVAWRWRATYPSTPCVAVGSPFLDEWHRQNPDADTFVGRTLAMMHRDVAEAGPRVAVTFHWECQLVPETLSALPHYRASLPDLVAAVRGWGGEVLGHGHPRAWPLLEGVWRQLGVPRMPDFAEVLDRADVLVGDNTSALYEFASTGRPVVALNAPWYRRRVEHGLRFWSHVPGVQIDQPDQLVVGVKFALADPPQLRALRERAVEHVYPRHDGRAAERAADAIEEALKCAK